MKNNENFQFEILQSAGGGTKSLMIPCRSSKFKWTAKQIIASAGRGYIYILAKEDLFFVKDEEKVIHAPQLLNLLIQPLIEIAYMNIPTLTYDIILQ
jgi:hypothetical protein